MALSSAIFGLLTASFLLCSRTCATDPQPVSVTPSTEFLGYDGLWSPVSIQVGTSNQQQWLSVLPNTVNQETWVIGPSGCDGTIACITKRGGVFYPNQSSTFQNIGYYELGLDTQLGDSEYGDYGLDTVTLNDAVSEPGQVIAVINTTEFWLGQLGLGVQQTRLNGSVDHLPFLSSLVQNTSYIPSHSYGYTAGAYYRLKSVPASLTLGGVDANRFTPNNMSFSLSSTYAPALAINSISLTSSSSSLPPNWNSNPVTLLDSSQAATFVIDTTTPFLWLPGLVCDNFANALNLTYNDTLQLYVFADNTTSPETLASWNLNFTFSLSNLPNSRDSTELTLPYDAFNLQLSYPFPNLDANFTSGPTNYFPLRRATNSKQYIIGRVFLQETYITVDYERNNFSISQAVFTDEAVSNVNLLSISRPSDSIFPGPASSGTATSGLSTGAKAGIGAGIGVAVVLAIVLIYVFCVRNRMNTNPKSGEEKPRRRNIFGRLSRTQGSGTSVSELVGDKRHPHEVAADSSNSRFELPGDTPIEMPAGEVPASYFAGTDGLRGSGPAGNDRGRPAELEPRGSMTKEAEATAAGSDRSGSPVPPYSPAELQQRFSTSISPYSTRHSPGFGTLSSGEQGISPVGNSHPRSSSSQYSNSMSSPISPEGGTSRSHGGSGPGTNESRSAFGSNNALLSPQVLGRMPSRSPSRGSRFVEEGLSGVDHPGSAVSGGNSARFSWED